MFVVRQDAQMRKEVCAAIQDADIDRAIQLVEESAPMLLSKQPALKFKLQCQQFMEMVGRSPPSCRTPSPMLAPL